ncbi:HAD family hydrolase [Saxibacter everestensis]|uniref:HAD family hydrolase n=1 Tax=Saxibacter everestensis TaxID=2909229 RepID=A0ABY8QS60_9MICO|nr:HAD family hydrolase [Brevibacteriaceae bacterium ZFBP1038]
MRLVASDIDGTILDHTGIIRPRVVEAFRACRTAGIEVVFVTGRPFRWVTPLEDQLDHAGTVICSNGSLIYDLANRKVLNTHAISVQDASRAARALRAAAPDVVFALETLDGFRAEPAYAGRGEVPAAGEVTQFDDLLTGEPTIVKMLAHLPNGNSDELLALAAPVISDFVSPTHSSPNGALIEIAPRGVNKSRSLAEYAEMLGIGPEDVVAFGDMPNDLEMLGWAGRGYAMADGHPAAIAAAHDVAPALLEDGVAQVLERILGEP